MPWNLDTVNPKAERTATPLTVEVTGVAAVQFRTPAGIYSAAPAVHAV